MTSSDRAVVERPTEKQIRITREFDAPRRSVYEALTRPELINQWFSEAGGEFTVSEVRVGETWRYVIATEGADEVASHGEYLEVVPNERVVSTQFHEAMPDARAVQTATFTEQDGRTTLTIVVEHASQEARDAHMNSVEAAMQKALDRLERVVGQSY
jgi:uncharacterized protein YndB with AHSA1/START domain